MPKRKKKSDVEMPSEHEQKPYFSVELKRKGMMVHASGNAGQEKTVAKMLRTLTEERYDGVESLVKMANGGK